LRECVLESEIVISLVQPAQAVAVALRISVCFSREIARGSAAPFETVMEWSSAPESGTLSATAIFAPSGDHDGVPAVG